MNNPLINLMYLGQRPFKNPPKMKFTLFLIMAPFLFTQANIPLSAYLPDKGYLTEQFQVTGTVTDENGVPLPGASVVVKGTTTGTVTDFDGKYSIDVVSTGTLVFSYIGYRTIEVAVSGNPNINATLPVDATQLDDVVVVGYGTQKKSEITSSISQIDGRDFQTSTASNAAMALQGRASGVEFVNSG